MQFIDLKAQQARIRADLDRRIAAVLDHGQYMLGLEIDEMEHRLAKTVQVSDRETVVQALQAQGIPTAVHYPVTLDSQPALAGLMSGSPSLPVSHRLAERVVSLPMHPYLDEATIGTIAQALTAATASLPSVH